MKNLSNLSFLWENMSSDLIFHYGLADVQKPIKNITKSISEIHIF